MGLVSVPAPTTDDMLRDLLRQVRALRTEVAAARAEVRSLRAIERQHISGPAPAVQMVIPPIPGEWLSAREAATLLGVCRTRKLPLLVKLGLLVPKHDKFARPDVERVKAQGLPKTKELANRVAALEQPLVRRRRQKGAAESVSLADWRPPKTGS